MAKKFREYYKEKFTNKVTELYEENINNANETLMFIACPFGLIKTASTYFNAVIISDSEE